MAQNVQTALATRVQDASGTFRRKQSAYMQRLKGHEIRHQEISGGGTGKKGNNGWENDNETALREDIELVSGLRFRGVAIPPASELIKCLSDLLLHP